MPALSWEAELLRLTVFTTLTGKRTCAEAWEIIAGHPGEDLDYRKAGTQQESVSGTLPARPSALLVSRQPARVDVLLSTPLNWTDEGKLVPAERVPIDAAIDDFRERVHRFLAEGTECARLAFGCTGRSAVGSRVQGYTALQEYLPHVQLDPEGSSDFSYQINRPRKAKSVHAQVTINRVSKWHVVTLQAQTEASGTRIGRHFASSELGCRVELDINTQAEIQAPLTIEMQHLLVDELMEFASEILATGDRA